LAAQGRSGRADIFSAGVIFLAGIDFLEVPGDNILGTRFWEEYTNLRFIPFKTRELFKQTKGYSPLYLVHHMDAVS
jgi:hypothetical protein